MAKTKFEYKYLLIFSFVLSFFIFIIFVVATYTVQSAELYGFLKYFIIYCFSLIAAISIALGISILSSTISDAMFSLRRMSRLENLSNPLLMRLSAEAPGTYHHSLNVSNIAQKACKKIGADSLLVRVASYYHDIGKLESPLEFIENQSSTDIPQDESAETIRNNSKKIIAHVENGVSIAKENNLPEDIIDIIAEHHGTTRTLYFYEKAKERGLKIKRTDFRYKGPTPQTKESAILMLADCVEATIRSEKNLTKETITNIVNSSIKERELDNQFKNSSLTENELAKVHSSMIGTILSIYHQRISYEQPNES